MSLSVGLSNTRGLIFDPGDSVWCDMTSHYKALLSPLYLIIKCFVLCGHTGPGAAYLIITHITPLMTQTRNIIVAPPRPPATHGFWLRFYPIRP